PAAVARRASPPRERTETAPIPESAARAFIESDAARRPFNPETAREGSRGNGYAPIKHGSRHARRRRVLGARQSGAPPDPGAPATRPPDRRGAGTRLRDRPARRVGALADPAQGKAGEG